MKKKRFKTNREHNLYIDVTRITLVKESYLWFFSEFHVFILRVMVHIAPDPVPPLGRETAAAARGTIEHVLRVHRLRFAEATCEMLNKW